MGCGCWGSSPLARGLPGSQRGPRGGRGIIPARAGFTYVYVSKLGSMQDHPRSRGVYICSMPEPSDHTGSSPLARGLRPELGEYSGRRGIIPARAGFTDHILEELQCRGDHPRSRGVYAIREGLIMNCGGSSPLARGLHNGGHQWISGRRIIPARAGFTFHPV